MGEFAVSDRIGDELAIVGIGSCIALILVDDWTGAVGVSHVVLPSTTGTGEPPSKYAELAVPHLLGELLKVGARQARLGAILVGGAQMFETTGTMAVGNRNAEAVHSALDLVSVPVLAEEIGGSSGRTARAVVGEQVTVQSPGKPAQKLIALKAPKSAPLTPFAPLGSTTRSLTGKITSSKFGAFSVKQ